MIQEKEFTRGLSTREAEKRVKTYGLNELNTHTKKSLNCAKKIYLSTSLRCKVIPKQPIAMPMPPFSAVWMSIILLSYE